MKKIIFSLLFSISLGLSAQFTFDSVAVYHRNFAIDSIYVRGVAQFNSIDTITYSNVALDACATTPFILVFKGCTIPTSKVIDTTYVFPFQTVWSKKIHFYAGWDTSSLCVSPLVPSYLDTLDWIPCFTTGSVVLNTVESKIRLFPNPAENMVFIETDFNLVSARLFNSAGKQIKTAENLSEGINLQNLPTGLYYVKIELSNGQIVRKKLIIK